MGSRSWWTFWVQSVRRSSTIVRVASVSLALVFATAQLLGWRVEAGRSLGAGGKLEIIVFGAEVLLTAVVFAAFLFPIFHFFATWQGLRGGSAKGVWALPATRRRLAIIGILIGCWLIYWLLLWPGGTSFDSYIQIRQALGQISYTDKHPIAMTLAIQAVLRPAIALTGSITRGIAVVSLAQLVVLAGMIGLCIDALRELRLPSWARTATLAFFALHPVIGWYSVTLWKDVWLAAFVLLLATTSTIIVHRSKLGSQITWKWWAAFALAALGVMFSKKTGIYLVAPMLLVTVFFVRGVRLRWATFGTSAIVLYLVAHAALLSAFDVQPGSVTEAFSLPSQQIARVVADHGDSLSVDDKTEILKYYETQDLGELYKPQIADPVKEVLNADALDSDLSGYLKLWLRLAAEYPSTYVEAFLQATSGYWYPGTTYPLVDGSDWTMNVNSAVDSGVSREEIDPQLQSNRVAAPAYRTALRDAVNMDLRQVPVLTWFFSLGAWAWVAVILAVAALLRRKSAAVPLVALQLLVWGTCMISPVYAESRYAYPILLLLPLLLVTVSQPANPVKTE